MEVRSASWRRSASLRSSSSADPALVPQGAMKSAEVEAFEVTLGGFASTRDPAMYPPPSLRTLVVSSVFGNMLEWYDFGVFASFSTEISKAFFTGGRLEEILQVYGVFAVAFFARPAGGFLLGLLGDKFGRTLSMQISVVAMGASALVISALPTNSVGAYSIGPSAAILLVLVRIVQGLSVGGEMVGSMLYMVENVPEKWRCTMASVPFASGAAGIGTGYAVSAIITAALSEEARVVWGWRLAFALGVPAGVVGFMFRTCLSESHSFSTAIKKFRTRHHDQHPFFFAFRNEPKALLVLCALSLLLCGYFGAFAWYNGTWLEVFYTELVQDGLSELHGRVLNTLLIFCCASGGIVLAAVAIDRAPFRWPLHRYILASAAILAVFTPIFLWLMSFGTKCLLCVAGGQAASMLCLAFTYAPFALHVASQVPVQLQYTSIGLSYNLGLALFGGTVPYVATAITVESPSVIGPSFYLSALAVLGGGSLVLSRLPGVRKMHRDLEQTMCS